MKQEKSFPRSDVTHEGRVELTLGEGEDENDIEFRAGEFAAGVNGADWTIDTLVSQMKKGRIDLSPSFQRRNAWLDTSKSKLIESILLGFPIPQLVLAEYRESPGHFFVLDGKQRLLALRQFLLTDDEATSSDFDQLRLTGLQVLKDLNGLTYSDLARDEPRQAAILENHTIRTVTLKRWTSEDMLLSLFMRLNTGSVSLSPQELRQALVPGEFMQWLDVASGESPALRALLNNNGPDRRMVDAEILLRHLAFSNSPEPYRGSLKSFLDTTAKSFNNDWGQLSSQLEQAKEAFELAISTGLNLFQRRGFARKWSINAVGEIAPERALNRAVLDFQAYSLTFTNIRDAVSADQTKILDNFKKLCVEDEEFKASITSTTKSVAAFRKRHTAWMELVRESTGETYPLPSPLFTEQS